MFQFFKKKTLSPLITHLSSSKSKFGSHPLRKKMKRNVSNIPNLKKYYNSPLQSEIQFK
jgi:hypothetical protein